MSIVIKAISKISIFSLIGIGLNGFLTYTFLRLWICPQVGDIEMIFNFTILMFFEFVMVHSGVFMSILGKSWKGWLFFICFYGLFALGFNAAVNNNQILILYCVVVLNRMLPKLLNREKTNPEEEFAYSNGKQLKLTKKMEKEILMSSMYAAIYFILLLIIAFTSAHIPQFGLTKEFLEIADYKNVTSNVSGELMNMPHAIMCFGVLYYLALIFIDMMRIIHRVNYKLASNKN